MQDCCCAAANGISRANRALAVNDQFGLTMSFNRNNTYRLDVLLPQ